ncbi:YaaC family protein [Mesorhizobium sp. M0701]|uniref:YaaC family protein n=1 Tax=unclassified Mesorhizobium TaxID=325217 RepID=UPI00333790B4
MDAETWQRLLSLESRDVVSRWFQMLHKNDLNARRAKEIIASAKQAREFFRSSAGASYAVRPLLTFYGVASLSRALTLVFRKNGGEEGLAKGHGLETVAWSGRLSGDLSLALAGVGALQVRTTGGLFSDLVTATKNRIALHVRSEAVDWRLDYDVPAIGHEFALLDILDRLPDVENQFAHLKRDLRYVGIQDISFTTEAGLSLKVRAEGLKHFRSDFTDAGYSIAEQGEMVVITADAALFSQHTPQFLHTYVHKMFDTIPHLYLVSQFGPGKQYSQIAVTYVLAYFLGMLARYYPTHWTALMMGEKGDALWPSINAAQHYVEIAFPELVLELIEDALKTTETP